MKYDLIVIGAGAAGAALATRASEDSRCNVLLLEAGPYYPTTAHMPKDLTNGNNNSYTAHDWGLRSEANAAGRLTNFPRGRVVGGSSAVNTAIALRGVPEDYDEWAALGNSDWSWEKVLPSFRKLENDLDFDDDFHGRNGPIPIRRYREDELTPVQAAFMLAMRAAGYPETRDNNDPDSTGLAPHPMNKQGRTRMSVAICYVEPVRHRLNLTIRGDCLTHRIVTDRGRAVGVEVESGGDVQTVEADRIVVSAGAIMTPPILMRSGIGNSAELQQHNIDVVSDLPGVGSNLDDHPMVGMVWLAKDDIIDLDAPLVQVTYRYTSSLGEERNDMQLMPVSGIRGPEGRAIFSIGSVVERQKSRGRVSLTSADPHDAPRIENNFCEHPDDVRRLVEGAKMALAIGERPEFDGVRERRLAPNDATFDDEAQLTSWVKHVAASGFHPSCTAKMAPDSDPTGVVDQHLRVRGFDNLYVADASVMPSCPRANIHLTSIMIGERAADFLKDGLW